MGIDIFPLIKCYSDEMNGGQTGPTGPTGPSGGGSQYITYNSDLDKLIIEKDTIVQGSLSADQLLATSDKNVKNNIQDLNPVESFEFIKKMRPVEYNKIKTGKEAGFLAQELEELDEFLVRDSNGTKVVNYNSIISILVSGLKNSQERIEELENQLKNKGVSKVE